MIFFHRDFCTDLTRGKHRQRVTPCDVCKHTTTPSLQGTYVTKRIPPSDFLLVGKVRVPLNNASMVLLLPKDWLGCSMTCQELSLSLYIILCCWEKPWKLGGGSVKAGLDLSKQRQSRKDVLLFYVESMGYHSSVFLLCFTDLDLSLVLNWRHVSVSNWGK